MSLNVDRFLKANWNASPFSWRNIAYNKANFTDNVKNMSKVHFSKKCIVDYIFAFRPVQGYIMRANAHSAN